MAAEERHAEDAVARTQALHARSGAFHRPGELEAGGDGEKPLGGLVMAHAHDDVGVVHPGGAHAHEDLAGAGLGVGLRDHLQNLVASGTADEDALHGAILAWTVRAEGAMVYLRVR